MNRFCILFLLILFSPVVLIGCGGTELDGRGIVTSLEVTKNNGLWKVQSEIVRFSDTETIPGQETELLTGQGLSLTAAMQQLNKIEGTPLYLGHLRLFLLNQSLLTHGNDTDLSELNDFFLQNREVRFQTLLAVSSAPFGNTLDSESIPGGNHGIDLSRQLRRTNYKTEIRDFINWREACAPPPSFARIELLFSENRQISYVG